MIGAGDSPDSNRAAHVIPIKATWISIQAIWALTSAWALAWTLLFAPMSPALAQLQLHRQPASGPVSHKSAGPRPSASAPLEASDGDKIAPLAPPSDDGILGQTLTRDGSKGVMRFVRTGKAIVLARLTLPGERLSKPAEACEVNIEAEQPMTATLLGHPQGATRWSFPLEACPLTVDVLSGSALVSSPRPACDFIAADCRVSPVGLWGPPGDSISAHEIRTLQEDRLKAETALRADFKIMVHRAGKDTEAVKALTAEQAAFSSEREMTCRDYKNESEHGFCSAQITQARTLALIAEYGERVAADNARRAEDAARRAAEEAKRAAERAKLAEEHAKAKALADAAKAAKAAEAAAKAAKEAAKRADETKAAEIKAQDPNAPGAKAQDPKTAPSAPLDLLQKPGKDVSPAAPK